MSLLGNPLQSGLLLQQAVLPYTFTTGELDSLKAKLQAAENQMMQTPNKQASMLPMSASEIRTLLRMIDMTYLQGLSGSGHYVQDCQATMSPMLHNQQQQQLNAQTLQQLNGLSQTQMGLGGLQQLNGSLSSQIQQQQNLSFQQQQQAIKNPPPANYVCHKCNIMGHWIQECPLNTQQQQDYTKPPPANYVCHRCGVPGHWIKNCPTNGNPTFDNKPHLKVIKVQESSVNGMPSSANNSQEVGSQNEMNAVEGNNANAVAASQPPSKKRRLNQM